MKNIYIKIFMLAPIFLMLGSCDESLDDLFLNPDKSTDTKVEYLMTDAMLNGGSGLRIGYNPSGYYLILQHIGPWTQLNGVDGNDAQMMDLTSNAIGGLWGQYYTGFMPRLKEMELVSATLSEQEQANYAVYLSIAKVLRAHGTARIADLYGDMPYSEAFTARTSEPNLFPKFDDQESVYKSIIADLKEASEELAATTLDPGNIRAHEVLSSQDILLAGDLLKWQKFANSLRLRLAMRISEVDNAFAQSVVQEILGGSAPLVETNDDNILQEAIGPDGLNSLGGGGGKFARAFEDRAGRTYAPKLMVDLMNAANDPRRAAHFQTTTADTYVGVPSSPDDQAGLDINSDDFSLINEELIRNNEYLPGIVLTASEVRFLKAEAIIKGYVAGDAEAEYNAGLRESVDFYYYLINLDTDFTMDYPDAADVDDFVNNSTAKFDGTLAQIYTQKWMHFGINQPNEAYAEQRRTDFPALPDDMTGGSVLERTTRILYPSTEVLNNAESYEAVRSKDTSVTRVWWDTE